MPDVQGRFLCSDETWTPSGLRSDAVAVLMSGGVDSSTATAMLRRAGRDVVGITMLIPSGLGPDCGGAEVRACCGSGASEIARQLGIPHYFVDVRDEFRAHVIEPFRAAYRSGRTPSPCIDCNTFIKFGVVMRLLREALGIEEVATGHYARIVDCADGPGLCAGVDAAKDQSYFLYGIRRETLPRLLFPLGGQTKERTRGLAAAYGLDFSDREESVELCFAGQGDYRAALGANPDAGPGDILDTAGRVIGRHRGISRYTIGQREGLGVAGGVPLYVVDIDPEANAVVLGDREAAGSRVVHAHRVNILAPNLIAEGVRCFGKVRYRQGAAPCSVSELSEERLVVEFDTPQHGVTPGQHLVLYSDSGRVLAGGEILRERGPRL